jgi:hypothetical protein
MLQMPKLFALILIVFSIAGTPAAAEEENCGPPPPKFKTEEEWNHWMMTEFIQRGIKYWRANPPNYSMMFRSPETIDQARKRKLFKKPIIDEVARRELLGKSIAEADQILKNLGFRRNVIKEQTPYHWEGSAGCYTLMFVRLKMTLTIADGMVAGVDTEVRHLSF